MKRESCVGQVVIHRCQTRVTTQGMPEKRMTGRLTAGADGDAVDLIQLEPGAGQNGVQGPLVACYMLDSCDPLLSQGASYHAIDEQGTSAVAEFLPEGGSALRDPDDFHRYLQGRFGQNACRVRDAPARARTNNTVARLRTSWESARTTPGSNMKTK